MGTESVISQKPKIINDSAKNCLDILIGGEKCSLCSLEE